MEKGGGEQEHPGRENHYLTPDSLSSTKRIGNNHVLNANNLSEEVSLTSVGADDNMKARKVSGDDDDGVRFSDDDSCENERSTDNNDDIVSDSGGKTPATAAVSATIPIVNCTVSVNDDEINGSTNELAPGWAIITTEGHYEDEFCKGITCKATKSTWSGLLKMIFSDGHVGRVPNANLLKVTLWGMLTKQGDGMNWKTVTKHVNGLPVYTYKITGMRAAKEYNCQMEILHDVIADTLSQRYFLRKLILDEFPGKCTMKNVAESIDYLKGIKEELCTKGGKNTISGFPKKMTFDKLPSILCDDPEDAHCVAPPHRAVEKGGKAEGTMRVHKRRKGKSPTGKSGEGNTKGKSSKKTESGGKLSKVRSTTKDDPNAKGAKRKRSRDNLGDTSDESQGEKMLRGKVDELLEQIKLQTNEVTQLRGEVACMKGVIDSIWGKMNGDGR